MMNAEVTYEQFCCHYISTTLVLGIASLSLQYSFHPSKHTFYQVLNHLLWYLIPFHLTALPKLLQTIRGYFILCQPLFQVPLQMFYRVNVRRLCKPLSRSMVAWGDRAKSSTSTSSPSSPKLIRFFPAFRFVFFGFLITDSTRSATWVLLIMPSKGLMITSVFIILLGYKGLQPINPIL